MKRFCLFTLLLLRLASPLSGSCQQISPQPHFVTKTPYRLSTALLLRDVDGDGHRDLVAPFITGGPAALYILPGNGQGAFDSSRTVAREANYWNLAVNDFDRDAIPDLVLSSYWDNGFKVYRGKGNNQFETPVYYGLGAHGGLVQSEDVNGDGNPDILVLTSGSGTSIVLHVFLGKGNGTFQPRRSYPSRGISGRAMKIIDLNHDGRPDVAIRPGSSYHQTFLQEADGSFTPYYQPLPHKSSSVDVDDLDHDRVPDLVTLEFSTVAADQDTLVVRKGDGKGTFPLVAGKREGMKSLGDLQLVDLNLDGYLDIISYGVDLFASDANEDVFDDFYTDTIHYLLGKADGGFGDVVTFSVPYRVTHLAVADLNNDRFPDVTALGLDNTVAVYLNAGGVHAGENVTVCADAPPFALSGFSPAGGSWSGPGVTTAGLFTPAVAGAGDHSLTYRITRHGCTLSATRVIRVQQSPAVRLTPFAGVCSTSEGLPLGGGQPAGGQYAGPGVSNGVFVPAAAGTGTHLITYTYADAAGCTGSATAGITVAGCPEEKGAGVLLSPNPTRDRIKVVFSAAGTTRLVVRVLGTDGRIVAEKTFPGRAEAYTEVFDLSGKARGLYLLQLADGRETITRRISLL